MYKYNLLLLTWTIKPDKWIKKQWYSKTLDENIRLKEYLSNISYYLSFNNIDWIVFIDNCNYSLDLKTIDSIKNSATILWKDFEYLTFKWDVKSQLKFSYWYWEFETIEYMLLNSTLYKKSTWLYKVTWRYKINNFESILNDTKTKDNIFYKYNIFNFNAYNTVFFKISEDNILKIIKWYKNAFLKYEDNKIRFWSEEIIFKIIWCNRNISSSKIYPYFYYLSFWKFSIYQFLNNLGYFNTNSFLFKIFYSISKITPLAVKRIFNKSLFYIINR